MNLPALLDELRVIAHNGLEYAEDPHDAYDEERYERILVLVAECYGEALALPPEEVRDRLAGELGHVTAKVAAGSAIFNENGQILLVKRADNGRWGLPAGVVEPNESAEAAAIRETREETGLNVEVHDLVGVYSELPEEYPTPHTVVGVIYRCTVTGGTLRTSHETDALRYWQVEDVPTWHRQDGLYASDAFEAWRNDGDP